MPREHVYETHRDCQLQHCSICDGGLAWCTVCTGGEGSLTTECPGKPMSYENGQEVLRGRLDYRDGKWLPNADLF